MKTIFKASGVCLLTDGGTDKTVVITGTSKEDVINQVNQKIQDEALSVDGDETVRGALMRISGVATITHTDGLDYSREVEGVSRFFGGGKKLSDHQKDALRAALKVSRGTLVA